MNAFAPLEKRTVPSVGFHFTSSPRCATFTSPLGPSIITLATSSRLPPISAIRASGVSRARCSTHSAPAPVLPKPRPAISSHTVQSPFGSACPPCACHDHSASSRAITRCGRLATNAAQPSSSSRNRHAASRSSRPQPHRSSFPRKREPRFLSFTPSHPPPAQPVEGDHSPQREWWRAPSYPLPDFRGRGTVLRTGEGAFPHPEYPPSSPARQTP